MLKATIDLIKHLNLEQAERNSNLIDSLVYSIIKCGDKTDANAVLSQYLKDPADFDHQSLLRILEKRGDNAMAEQIFNTLICNNKLNQDAEPEILELLGNLKYTPIKPVLIDYIFGNDETESEEGHWHVSRSAALGLLNFDCGEYQSEIKAAIEKCYGKNLFPEFIPALVCKLNDREIRASTLEKIYELGSTSASLDCIGGIILGFSLCEEEGGQYFRKILFDQNWEVFSSATGAAGCTYKGLGNLGITFRELYNEIKKFSNKDHLRYALRGFFSLLEIRILDTGIYNKESLTDISTLFNVRHNDHIFNLAEKVEMRDEAYDIGSRLELKMDEEAILKNYIN